MWMACTAVQGCVPQCHSAVWDTQSWGPAPAGIRMLRTALVHGKITKREGGERERANTYTRLKEGERGTGERGPKGEGSPFLGYDRRYAQNTHLRGRVLHLAYFASGKVNSSPFPLILRYRKHTASRDLRNLARARRVTGLGHSFLRGHRALEMSSDSRNPSFEENACRRGLLLTCWADSVVGSQTRASAPGLRRRGGSTEPSAPPSFPGCRP